MIGRPCLALIERTSQFVSRCRDLPITLALLLHQGLLHSAELCRVKRVITAYLEAVL